MINVARLYVLENIRKQVHLITLFVGLALLMLPAYVNAFSLGLNSFERVAKDFGLTVIDYFGIALTIYLAATAVPGDMERRTIYPMLARPMTRSAYLRGKFLGISIIVCFSLTALAVCLMAAIGLLAQEVDLNLLTVTFAYALEALVVGAVTFFCSTIFSPSLAGVLGAFVYITGGLTQAFIQFFLVEDRQSPVASGLAWSMKAVLPHFEVFRIKDAVVHGEPLSPLYLLAITVYACVWTSFFLLLANERFQKRNL